MWFDFSGRHVDLEIVNVDKIQEFIDMGKLIPKSNEMITMRDLLASGVISKVREGIKLLGKVRSLVFSPCMYHECYTDNLLFDDQQSTSPLKYPIHIEVSRASDSAIKLVEAAGGTVTCSHFNRLALRALIKPYKFELLPRRARPPPKLMNYYLDVSKSGYLSPEVQARNLKLFGHVTSEHSLRLEHDRFMDARRVEYAQQRAELEKKIHASSST